MAKSRLAEIKELKAQAKTNVEETTVPTSEAQVAGVTELSSRRKRRPKVGEYLKDEPTQKQIAEAAINAPSDVLFTLAGEQYPVVELGFLQSKVYLDTLIPYIEKAIKQLAPAIYSGTQFWFFARNMTTDNMEALRSACLEEGVAAEVIGQVFQNWGYPMPAPVCQELVRLAPDKAAFNARLSQAFMAPVIDILKNISVADLLAEATDALPDLVTASIVSSAYRTGRLVDHVKIKEQATMEMDVIDMFYVATEQIELYKERGKIRSFFAQLKKVVSTGKVISEMLGE